jgi:hypothetical protein
MKDVAGNELSIGDMVAFTKTPNKNNVLQIGYITGFTAKKITIASSPDGPKHKPTIIGVHNRLPVDCKFPEQVAKIFIKNDN